MRGCVLLMGLSGFFLGQDYLLVAMIVLLMLFGLLEGMQGVIFNYLMSKVIPVKKRGRLTGFRNFLAGTTAAVVAYIWWCLPDWCRAQCRGLFQDFHSRLCADSDRSSDVAWCSGTGTAGDERTIVFKAAIARSPANAKS